MKKYFIRPCIGVQVSELLVKVETEARLGIASPSELIRKHSSGSGNPGCKAPLLLCGLDFLRRGCCGEAGWEPLSSRQGWVDS